MSWSDRTGLVVGAGATVGLGALWVLARQPWRLERWYVEGAGPPLQALVCAFTRHVPSSLAEWLEAGSAAVALGWLVWVGVRVLRGRGRRARELGRAALTAWIAVSAVGFWFYVAWGLAYARPSARERMGWAAPGAPSIEIELPELTAVGSAMVDRVNQLYDELHGWPDAYVVSAAPRGMEAVDRAVDVGWERMVAVEGLHPTVARSRGPSKPLLSSVVFAYLGIGGFYFPFTAEANVNALQPEWQRAFTLAHEKAHQRFVASEDEANFFGFLAMIHAEDPFVRYGGWLFAQRQVLGALGERDPYGFWAVIERRYPGVQRDVNFGVAFWAQYDGRAHVLSSAVNDRYLRFNGVAAGKHSYSESLQLVVEWARHHPEVLGIGAPGR